MWWIPKNVHESPVSVLSNIKGKGKAVTLRRHDELRFFVLLTLRGKKARLVMEQLYIRSTTVNITGNGLKNMNDTSGNAVSGK